MSTHLGKTVTEPIEARDIDVWPLRGVQRVEYEGHELQALCPVTHQPDIYRIVASWTGDKTLESKGVKLYLWSFRDQGIGCEDLAYAIASDLSARLGLPVTVTLTQQPRGGLTLRSTVTGSPA